MDAKGYIIKNSNLIFKTSQHKLLVIKKERTSDDMDDVKPK